MLRERATAHSIELRVELGEGLGAVEADELRFKQVVLNLVSNAVKFTPDGGSVVIRAAEVGADLHVTVTDTGVGVPVDDRERIFESFQQGGRGASREEGTGLGLTLSRRIVELFGGRMWLVSEVGARPPGVLIMPLMSIAHETDFVADWSKLQALDAFTPKERKWAAGAAFGQHRAEGYEGEGWATVRSATTEGAKKALLTVIQRIQVRYG